MLNIVLAFVPDLVVAWAAMRLTDSGWSGLWITFLALQAIYVFFWFKQALWSWLLFWIIGRRQTARYLEDFFIDSRCPLLYLRLGLLDCGYCCAGTAPAVDGRGWQLLFLPRSHGRR